MKSGFSGFLHKVFSSWNPLSLHNECTEPTYHFSNQKLQDSSTPDKKG